MYESTLMRRLSGLLYVSDRETGDMYIGDVGQNNWEEIDYIPFNANDGLAPIYKELDGWDEDLMNLEKLEDAPKAFHNYIKCLETELKIPITIVSVGPDRKQTFCR